MSHLPNAASTRSVVRERWASAFPSLVQVLQDSETAWQKFTVDWYGEGERTMEFCTGTALWYRYGYAPLPISWVLTRYPSGKRPPKAIFPTDPLLFGLYSLVTLFGQALHLDGHVPVAQAPWYRKQAATFRDVLATVRRHLRG